MRLSGLYTCDLICWGAASPSLFADYLHWLGAKLGSKVVIYRHRAKGPWASTRPVATLADGREVSGVDVGLWTRLWYGKLCRPSCNVCGFHSTDRPGDVTIGDYWGLEQAHPRLSVGDGASCLLVNSKAGAELVDACSNSLFLVPSRLGLVANEKQPMLLGAPEPDDDRSEFWQAYYMNGFAAASSQVGAIQKRTLKNMIRSAVRRTLESLLKHKNNPSLELSEWKEAEMSESEKEGMHWPKVYAAKNVSDDVRKKSASGGMFYAFASAVIAEGGVVYGCAFDGNLRAVHIRCETMSEVERCMGSKYSQSHMGNTIKDVIADREAGRTVLFTGTPCQVAAIKACAGNIGGGPDPG